MWTSLLLHSAAALVLIIAATQLIDWVFSGTKLMHKYYAAHAEVWRPMQADTGANARVVWVSLAGSFLFAIAFLIFYIVLQPGVIFGTGATRAIIVAIVTWAATALPLLLVQHVFIKFHRAVTAAFIFGWLFKLMAAALIITYLI